MRDWERASAEGVLRPDPEARDEYFGTAYEWMHRQMALRVASYGGGPLLWAWLTPKPDLRRGGHLPARAPGVRVEFRADSDDVLLSHFLAWHAVLNDGFLAWNEAEYDSFHERHAGCCAGSEWSAACHAEVERSWQRVFDLDTLATDTDWNGDLLIQAVLEAVPLRDVTRVDAFVAR
jgi:hypothetical protein